MSAAWAAVAVTSIAALVAAAVAYTRWTFKLGALVDRLTTASEQHTAELARQAREQERQARAIRDLQRQRFRDRLQ